MKKLTLEYIDNWLKRNRPEFELCENNIYKGTFEKLRLYHNTCKEYFYMAWNSISHGIGCPVCSGQQVGERTSLAYLRPDLALEWHPDNKLTPEEVTFGCNEKVYWICSICNYGENREWVSSINNRTNSKNGCPACSSSPKVVTDRNRLSILYPEIALEWHPTKNGNLTPDGVSYGANKKVWWLCPEGHEYYSNIDGRTINGHACKQCADKQHESKIASELKEYFIQNYCAEDEYEICINPKTNYYLPYDIYIPRGTNPELTGYYIEVQGHQHSKFTSHWHKSLEQFKESKRRDKIKKQFAKKHGTYIEIDLRKIKTTEEAIDYIEGFINND